MIRKFSVIVFLMIFFLACSNEEKSSKKTNIPKLKKTVKIFIVHSYEKEHVCGFPQEQGIKNIFNNSNYQVSWEFYYMNTKTENVSPELKAKQAKIAINRIEKFKPKILFVLDDNAIKLVGTHFLGREMFVIFSGMNGQPEDYNKKFSFLDENGIPNKNMTGIYEFLHVKKSFEIMYRLFPSTKKVLAIIDETTTGNAIIKQLELELLNEQFAFDFEIERITTIKQYKKIISKINKDDDYGFVYNIALGLESEGEKQVGVPVTFKYYLQNANKPSIALNYAFSRLGIFGGVAVNFEKMGEQAAEIGLKLLAGTPINETPIENDEKYMVIFNKARANQLGIKIPQDIELIADELYENMQLLD